MKHNTVESNEMRHNYLAFVNGEMHKAYAGKNDFYIHTEPVKGLHSWVTKSELEKLGCTITIRSGRN